MILSLTRKLNDLLSNHLNLTMSSFFQEMLSMVKYKKMRLSLLALSFDEEEEASSFSEFCDQQGLNLNDYNEVNNYMV